MASSKEVLRAEGLIKKFVLGEVEVQALRGVDFTINEGEFVVVLGPSGSGKSTMLNIIGGIETITDGKLFYNDLEVHKLSKSGLTDYRRKYVGFIFQFYNLMPNLTAMENIELAAELTDNALDPKELIKAVGLEQRAEYFPAKMSGGQQQRVAIARALCKNPDLLLCDEPTGALDTKTGIDVIELLLDFNKKYNKTIIVVTHNANIALVADKVFYFRDGHIEKVVINEKPLTPSEVEW
ncbi:MAG: ABC transporter ATP-binding protein [Firmicutes bacterium]|nr:ABC transporter ATP-binding protein [Bacillota bacterium]